MNLAVHIELNGFKYFGFSTEFCCTRFQ